MSTVFAKEIHPTVCNGAVRFAARFEGRKCQEFEISGDVLAEHFGAAARSEDALLEAFRRGRAEILGVATESVGTPTNGIVQLGTGDFQA